MADTMNPNVSTRLFRVRLTPGIVVKDAQITHSGYILLDSGIERFARVYGAAIETESDECDGVPVTLKIVRVDGVEVIQIDERDAAGEPETCADCDSFMDMGRYAWCAASPGSCHKSFEDPYTERDAARKADGEREAERTASGGG